MPAEIAILDRDMCYLAVSRRFAEAYNVNYDGIIGRSHYDLFPEIPDRWREIHRRCLAGDTERCAEDQFPREDGSLDWVSWEIFPWTDEGDAIGGIVIISENITSRKKFEEALLQSQQDLNHAQAVAHIGSWRLDVRNNILHWSDENYRIFGAPQGEPQTYQSFLEFVHPADREMVDAAWMNALAGKPYDIEHRILVDQKTKWVREQAILEFDENGVLTAGFGTTQDITDVVSARHALSRERAFLRQVIDAVPSLVFVKDRGGRFLLSNQALARCYGTDTGSIIGLTDEKLNLNADETAGFNRDDLDVITSGETKYILEEKVTHSDGVVHWYDTVKVPLVEDDGRCDKVLGVATDVTKRKHAEDLLRLVDRRKDDFLAMLAHELRNPLA
ncbi:MAG: PAS domain-containing protein, partial [Gammaproteobacteria bacterium]|nr:PAS domain-containing protein [Gammaproteobacteria bacterium]